MLASVLIHFSKALAFQHKAEHSFQRMILHIKKDGVLLKTFLCECIHKGVSWYLQH